MNLLERTGFENWGLYQCWECMKLGASSQSCVGVGVSPLPQVTQVQALLPTMPSSIKFW